ncbi:unnamed protein product [Victoria cruziana]
MPRWDLLETDAYRSPKQMMLMREMLLTMSIFSSCIADPGPNVLPGADSSTVLYDSSLGLASDLPLRYDDSSHDHDSIDSSFDHSSPDDLVSSHSLSFEEREADGGYDVLATTILHRNRSHPISIESLPPLALEPDSSSLESPPVMELKLLLQTLKYVYLGSDDSLSVIISSVLSSQEEKRLLAVSRGHLKAIGWKVADLRGINPAFCQHRIHTLEGSKPTREFQRRLNPTLKEVVKKEIIKWLDTEIIFPISDSEWVSPVQVVPKKAGLTMVKNEHGEEIPTRAQTGWRREIEVDKVKIEMIAKLAPPSCVREVRSFLGHAGFYRRFIKDFSNISRPLCDLLAKDVAFVFSEQCRGSFFRLKEALISAPILRAPDWTLPFEIMCDASDYAIEAILG